MRSWGWRFTRANAWFWISTILIAVALVVAAVFSTPLTWDGSLYYTYILDAREPLIPQGRIGAWYLQYPIVWVLQLTESLDATLFAFSLLHVITPLVVLLASWWIVRDQQPQLMIWPTLAMGLALLPGQINFISEAIKAEQLMWPLLLAILIGAPRRTIPLIILLAFFIYHLHPVSAAILAACGLAGIVTGFLNKEARTRLLVLSVPLVLAGIYKYSGITSGYEQSEMSTFTQQRQWENGTEGLPWNALVAALVVATGILIRPVLPSLLSKILGWVQITAIVTGGVSLVMWAHNPSLWWQALEFRGPAFWITMFLTGCLFIHTLILHVKPGGERIDYAHHIVVLSAGFCIVLIVQSFAWNGVVKGFQDQLKSSGSACLVREELDGFPHTPLNLWSTNTLSFVHQGFAPEVISMSTEECHFAKESGQVFTGSSRMNSPERFDYSMLSASLEGGTMCTWQYQDGWSFQEAWIANKWRWSAGYGTLIVNMPEAGQVSMTGWIDSIEVPNIVEISLNGSYHTRLTFDSGTIGEIDNLVFDLPAGSNLITFRSKNEPISPAGDERLLAISLWNPVFHPADGSSRCMEVVDTQS